MKHAILAAEDERFYQHGGVDYLSIARAALSNVTSGTQQGAGTITMQVARNFFLTREKTVSRKLREVLLAWKIEASLPKDEILELYINQIFLGQRAYGFAAAAQIYFGKPLADVTVAEAAMLAGLPKAPSAYNPVSNPRRAKTRQLYVLRRMHELGYINDDQWRKAQSEPLTTRVLLREPLSVHAEFVAEMARQVVYDAYGDDAYTRGITVWTTIRRADQEAAYAAVRQGVMDYDLRHGYRGPDGFVNLPEASADQDAALDRVFQENADSDGIVTAVVLQATPAQVRAVLASGDQAEVTGAGLKLAARALADKAPANLKLRRGAIIRLVRDDKGNYAITQCRRPRPRSWRAPRRRRDPRADRRLRLRPQQVQPRDAGVAAARLAFKPFIYSARSKRDSRPPPSSTTPRSSCRPTGRRDAWDRRITTASSRARCGCAWRSRNRRTSSPSACCRPSDRSTRRTTSPASASIQAAPAYLTMGSGGLGHADADGHRVFGVRERRLPDHAVPDHPDRRQPWHDAFRGEAGARGARTPSARSTRATRSSCRRFCAT
jgi:hypothetical protein